MSKWEAEDLGLDLGDLHESPKYAYTPASLTSRFTRDNRTLTVRATRTDSPGDESYTVRVKGDNGPVDVHYNVTTVQLSLEGQGLISADLRDIPLRELVVGMIGRQVIFPNEVTRLSPAERAALLSNHIPRVPKEVREAWPNGDRDLVYEYVALVYNAALRLGKPPTKSVGEAFHVNPGTGSRLVQYARKAGVLTSSSVNDPRKRKKDTKDDSGSSTD